MKKLVLTSVITLALAASLNAAPVSFDFKDPKGVNALQFSLDSVLEPIAGTAGGVSGTVSFDPANPAATSGKIVVATKSLVVPNATMTEHMLGNNWLDAAANPEIIFQLSRLEGVSTAGNVTTFDTPGRPGRSDWGPASTRTRHRTTASSVSASSSPMTAPRASGTPD